MVSEERDDDDGPEPLRLAWMQATLFRAVGRLALPADDQREYLRQIGTPELADELALELVEGAHFLSRLGDAGWIQPETVALVRRIEELLDGMGDARRPELWDPAALSAAVEWAEIRGLARQFLFRTDAVDID